MVLIGIDLFSGAGGLSLGATAAGIKVALAVEVDPHAVLTYSHNLPSAEVLLGDIRHLSKSAFGQLRRRVRPAIIFGGSPCQGFSHSNQRTRSGNNETNWLYLEFLRVTRICRPDWVVFENVSGIKDTAKGIFLNDFLHRLSDQGYTVCSRVLNAADFGVPQYRERLFVIGSRGGRMAAHVAPLPGNRITVADAISDLPSLSNGANVNWLPYSSPPQSTYSKLLRGGLEISSNHLVTRNADYVTDRYRHIPPGRNWTCIPRRLMHNYRRPELDLHTGLYRRLEFDKPSIVLGNYRKNMLIHPSEERGLSVREAARLQSFPDWYEFRGSIGFQQQQVGNAVPPLLAKAVFAEIVEASGGV